MDGGAAMRYYGWVVAMLIVVRLGAGIARGQNSEWVGTNVVTKYPVPLRVGGQVVDDGAAFRIYEVEEVNGDRLWLAVRRGPRLGQVERGCPLR